MSESNQCFIAAALHGPYFDGMMQTTMNNNKQGRASSRGLFSPRANTAHDHFQRALINLELFGPRIGDRH